MGEFTVDSGLQDLSAPQISYWSSISHFTSHNFVIFTHQMCKILITDLMRKKYFYIANKPVMIEGFKVYLIYIQKHPVRSEGRMCWTVSPKLPYKSPCILYVPILQNAACLPFLLCKMVVHNLSTTCPQIRNYWLITIYHAFHREGKRKKKHEIRKK